MKYLLIFLMAFSSCHLFGERHITISKDNFELAVVEKSDTLFKCPVAVGSNYGNKEKSGDRKTPEGTFTICSIENASQWEHDFKDGKGMQKGAYGPYFFRLKVPRFRSIGIHGTCKPESIGTRSSEGCIRLHNTDLVQLKKYVFVGMTVIINKDTVRKRITNNK